MLPRPRAGAQAPDLPTAHSIRFSGGRENADATTANSQIAPQFPVTRQRRLVFSASFCFCPHIRVSSVPVLRREYPHPWLLPSPFFVTFVYSVVSSRACKNMKNINLSLPHSALGTGAHLALNLSAPLSRQPLPTNNLQASPAKHFQNLSDHRRHSALRIPRSALSPATPQVTRPTAQVTFPTAQVTFPTAQVALNLSTSPTDDLFTTPHKPMTYATQPRKIDLPLEHFAFPLPDFGLWTT